MNLKAIAFFSLVYCPVATAIQCLFVLNITWRLHLLKALFSLSCMLYMYQWFQAKEDSRPWTQNAKESKINFSQSKFQSTKMSNYICSALMKGHTAQLNPVCLSVFPPEGSWWPNITNVCISTRSILLYVLLFSPPSLTCARVQFTPEEVLNTIFIDFKNVTTLSVSESA